MTPTPSLPVAQQTALAQLTVTPAPRQSPTPPAATPVRANSPVATPPATAAGTTGTPGATSAVTPVPVTETPGLNALTGGAPYTNPAKTFQISLPTGWSTPTPDPTQPGRIVTRAPKDALTLSIEEGPAPDDWARLSQPVVAGLLDTAYRKNAPGTTLQAATLTGISGVNEAGLPTYRFIYGGTMNGSPVTVERFVTLTFAGAITITTTATPDVDTAMRPTIEGIVGSLVPLRLDVPTPAALAPSGGTGAVTRTPSGLGIALPNGWAAMAPPAMPPGVEYAARSASGDQRLRIVHKAVTDSTKLSDFAATAAGELKVSASAYEVESESMNTIGGVRAVRNLYRATLGGQEVVGQSVALIKGTNGYVVSVEAPAAQYDAKPDDAQALFDRIESSVMLP